MQTMNMEPFQDETTEFTNTNGYSGPDTPPDDKPYRPRVLWKRLTTVFESVSWHLLYKTNEVVGYRLLLSPQEDSLSRQPFSWIPVVATVVVGLLSKRYWNPEAPMFNQLDEQASNQQHELQIITLMDRAGGGSYSQATDSWGHGQSFNMQLGSADSSHCSFVNDPNNGDDSSRPTSSGHSYDENCPEQPCCNQQGRCILLAQSTAIHLDDGNLRMAEKSDQLSSYYPISIQCHPTSDDSITCAGSDHSAVRTTESKPIGERSAQVHRTLSPRQQEVMLNYLAEIIIQSTPISPKELIKQLESIPPGENRNLFLTFLLSQMKGYMFDDEYLKPFNNPLKELFQELAKLLGIPEAALQPGEEDRALLEDVNALDRELPRLLEEQGIPPSILQNADIEDKETVFRDLTALKHLAKSVGLNLVDCKKNSSDRDLSFLPEINTLESIPGLSLLTSTGAASQQEVYDALFSGYYTDTGVSILKEHFSDADSLREFLRTVLTVTYAMSLNTNEQIQSKVIFRRLMELARVFNIRGVTAYILDQYGVGTKLFFETLYKADQGEKHGPLKVITRKDLAKTILASPKDGTTIRVAMRTNDDHWQALFIRWSDEHQTYQIIVMDSLGVKGQNPSNSHRQLDFNALSQALLNESGGDLPARVDVYQLDHQRQNDDLSCTAMTYHDIKRSFSHDPFDDLKNLDLSQPDKTAGNENSQELHKFYTYKDVHSSYMKTCQSNSCIENYVGQFPERGKEPHGSPGQSLKENLTKDQRSRSYSDPKQLNTYAMRKLIKYTIRALGLRAGIHLDLPPPDKTMR